MDSIDSWRCAGVCRSQAVAAYLSTVQNTIYSAILPMKCSSLCIRVHLSLSSFRLHLFRSTVRLWSRQMNTKP